MGVGQVDGTASPGLFGRFQITAVPTIFHVKEGVVRRYWGARDKDSFISFVKEKKWQGVEPVPEWKSPDSIQSSLVSFFFMFCMVLHIIQTILAGDYQLPYRLSNAACFVASLLFGEILKLYLGAFLGGFLALSLGIFLWIFPH